MRCIRCDVVCALLVVVACTGAPAAAQDSPFEQFTSDWRTNSAWNDGKAECAVYDATRTIYGKQRTYRARAFTNTEHASPETFTKSDTGEGRHVFKHHVRDDIPTANYTYHFSTMCYVGVDDLKSLKLDMGSQEDCGATFKQYVNHAPPGEQSTMRWRQFSYFPNEGRKAGEAQPGAGFVFQDALSLVLRGFPFEDPPEDSIAIDMLPDQTDTHLTPASAQRWHVNFVGKQTLSLPVGEVAAYHVRVSYDGAQARPGSFNYWFAAEGGYVEGEAGLHIMVKYEGPDGQTYALRAVERLAYWR